MATLDNQLWQSNPLLKTPAVEPFPTADQQYDAGVQRMYNAKGTTGSAMPTVSSPDSMPGGANEALAQSLRFGGSTPMATPDTTVAPEPTIGESLNMPTYETGPSYEDLYPEIDEDNVRRNQMKLFQQQINATNQVYDTLLNEARLEGQGRLGSQRASAARGGLLGSDFGASQKSKVQDYNTDINRGIQAERSAAIGAIMGTMRQSVQQELAEKRAARQQGAENYLAYLSAGQDRKNRNLNLAASALLTQGIDPTTMDEAELAAIGQEAGLSSADIINQYRILQSQQAAEAGDQFTLSEGEQRFDAQGNLIAEGPAGAGNWTVYSTSSGLVRVNPDTGETQRLTSGGIGGGGSSSSVSFTSSEKKKLEQAGLSNAPRQEQLDHLYGDDSTDQMTLDAARQWATANMSMGREALKNELIAGGLSVTLTNGVLDEVGLSSDRNVLSPTQFDSNVNKIATSLRKAAASLTKSSEEELAIARAQAEKGTLKISGKEYVLTPEQKQQLLTELDTLGPRTLIEQILPGGG